MLDILPMSKFNVLHVHLVDAQSFPFDSPAAPYIKDGAYAPSLTYSADDLTMLSAYGSDRGVRVIYEVDVPGHAASWNAG
jgi:hexosaminidase